MNKTKRTLFILLVLIYIPTKIISQDNTMYQLHQLPQANILNPAVDFGCKLYVELPVISSIQFAYNNTSFTYQDLIHQGTGQRADSLIIDLDNLYGNLRKNNAIRSEFQNVILGAGFHWKKYFISARIYQAHHAGLFYQKELIALKDGNWDTANDSPVSFSLSKNEANAISYLGFSLGVSKQFNESVRVGAKINYLKGMINATTVESDLNIVTSDRPVTVGVNTNYEINASMPLDYTRDSLGRIYSARPVFDNFMGNYIFNKNRGLAIDLGIVYDYYPKLKLSASILNLGFIRWKTNAVKYKANGSINLIGVDLDQYVNNSTDFLQLLRDTIQNSFNYTDSPTKYFTALPVDIYAGGNYEITSKLHVGLVGNLYVYNYATFPTLTATINVKPNSLIDLTGSISYANRTLRNIGFALVLGNAPVNFYIATDIFPVNYVVDDQSGLLFPSQSRSFNVRFGFNLVFGCKNRIKKSSGFICPAYD